jgi:hypothetical protein
MPFFQEEDYGRPQFMRRRTNVFPALAGPLYCPWRDGGVHSVIPVFKSVNARLEYQEEYFNRDGTDG